MLLTSSMTSVRKFIQMVLECRHMIGLSCKFVSLHILTRRSQWSCRNMIFWLFGGLNRHCALKYDVKYHKMAHNFTQGSCSPSCHRVKICYSIIALRDNTTICLLFSIIYAKWIWTISWYLTSYLTSQSSLTLQKVKWLEFQH